MRVIVFKKVLSPLPDGASENPQPYQICTPDRMFTDWNSLGREIFTRPFQEVIVREYIMTEEDEKKEIAENFDEFWEKAKLED